MMIRKVVSNLTEYGMFLRALALGLFLPLSALAETLPAPLSDAVSDYDDVIAPEIEALITTRLAEIRADTGVHMVVVAMDRLASHGGGNQGVETYAEALFNAWGVGDAARNDGILLLVVTGDRVLRFALGSGYDAVYNGRAKRVIETAILPEFSEGRIGEGILAGVTLTEEQLITPFLAARPIAVDEGFSQDAPPGSGHWLVILAVIGGGIIYGIRRAKIAARTCPNCGGLGITALDEVLTPANAGQDGNGLRHITCALCGHAARQAYSITRHSDPDGGGSGGFGGGQSSGGGATGRW